MGSGGGGGGGTPSGNGAFILSTNLSNPTNAGDILTLDSAGNAQDLTLNSTKLFLSTSTAPTNVSTSWTYSFATSQPELQTNALVGYVVSNSGYSCTAPCNNFTGLTVTASTTTTFTVVNVNGSATNTGTPLATFGTPLYPAIITSTLFSIGNALTSWGFIGGGFVSGSSCLLYTSVCQTGMFYSKCCLDRSSSCTFSNANWWGLRAPTFNKGDLL